jgi:cupin 2 domain-containing protein
MKLIFKKSLHKTLIASLSLSSFYYFNTFHANTIKNQNIFETELEKPKEELFETILNNKNFKLERIITNGQTTPPGEWYNQENDEWVVLLKGSAMLLFEDEKFIILNQGDHILIPKHCKHRVQWVDPNQECIWLALHFKEN